MPRPLRASMLAGLAWLAVGPAAAQPRSADTSLEQIPSSTSAASGADQITLTRPRVTPDQITRERAGSRGSPQLSLAGALTATAQLAVAGQGASAPAQVSQGRRSAQGVAPLSTSQEGRTATVARVGGRDRCDPAAASAASAACAKVIETRSAEFEPPSVEALSPEERLLATKELKPSLPTSSEARDVARILQDGDLSRSLTAQRVASLTQSTRAAEEQATQSLTAQQAAAAAAVIAALAGSSTAPLAPISPR